MNSREPPFRRGAWPILLSTALLFAPQAAMGAAAITGASIERQEGRTRLVISSPSQLKFSLLIRRFPNRIVLELDDVLPSGELAKLTDDAVAGHPYIGAVDIAAPPVGGGTVRLEFSLKGEVEPSIRSEKAREGPGYWLVLDFVPPGGSFATATPPEPLRAAPASPPPAVDAVQSSTTVAAPTPPAAAPATAPDRSRVPAGGEPDLVLLELRLDNTVLDQALASYQQGRATFLPLGELAKLLTLAIRTQPEQGTAEGFVLTEGRVFSLNLQQRRLQLGDQTQAFDPGQVRLKNDDIYVDSQLLSRWLPVDFAVDLSSLTLRATSRERLPLQERWDRERLAARTGGGSAAAPADPGYPRHDIPYRLLGVPFVDQRLGLGFKTGKGRRESNADYTAFLTGDLLGMESALFVSSSKHEPTPEVRFTLARHDPDAGLLGPAQARSVMFGSGVSTPSVANVAFRSPTGEGLGLAVSNRPLTQPTNFDRHTLQGDLPPGWDVELYFNEGLAGFQTSRPDGRYSFDDLPLSYGANEFRLVFNGPLGQQRVERQSFLLEQSSTPPGAFYYNLVQHQDGSQSRSVAQFEWGLGKSLTATGGVVRLPGSTWGASNPVSQSMFTNLGMRAFWNSYIFSTDFVRDSDGGWLNESGVKTRLGGMAVSYSHTLLRGFSSEVHANGSDSLVTRDKLRLDGTIPSTLLPRLPVTLEVQREEFESGRTNVGVTGRISAYVNRTSIANQVTWQSSGPHRSAAGTLIVSRRVGDMGVGAQLGYGIEPHSRLQMAAIALDKRLGGGYQANFGLTRTMDSRETLLTASLNKSVGKYGFGVTTSYSSHGIFSVGLQLFMSMGREPREGNWRFDAQPRADSGSVSARVFLDTNANGVRDPGEEPIENVALVINGSRAPVRTDAEGIAWLDRVPTRQHVDIHVDAQTLEDPYWAPLHKGVRLVPRPGQPAQLEFPVVLTSEIDGTVYLLEKSVKRGIGDVDIEVLDAQRKLLSTIKTGSDGFYIVPALVQGRYYLRISPQQLKQFELVDPGLREVTILPDGKFINGLDFELTKAALPVAKTSGR